MQPRQRGRKTLATDDRLEPAERLLIAVFRQARIDVFSTKAEIREVAEHFLALYGYNIEEIRAAWANKRQA